ncbi:MAG TPA: hypothetical protein PKD46_00240 [Aggregatilineaceae bacterium]|jgi:hypothetical protein|nr:GldG family protein [Anaerolineae bacterium]HMM26693.1 hypothetical protein [Aggregatilineaceae bacterium]
MRRTVVLLTVQVAVIVTAIALSIPASSPTLAQNSGNMFTRLDGANIYFSEASREATPYDRSGWGLSRFAGLLSALGANIHVLDWRADVPANADLVVIASPTRDIEDYMSARLWAYLKNGGALLIMADPLIVREDGGVLITEMNSRALKSSSGLFLLTWPDFGIRALDDVVVTENAAGGLDRDLMTSEINANHPILQNVTGPLAFFGARSIEIDSSIQPYEAQGLVFTAPDYYGETVYVDYLQLNTEAYNPGTDTARGRLPLIAASENRETGARIVLIGDGGFAANGEGFVSAPSNSAGFVFPANVQLMMNTVAWLVRADPAQTETFEFPTPGATATPTPVIVLTPTPTPAVTEEANADEASG